ncbi:MAG: hypothetical protein HFJ41_03045 [Clostridia bacterium]|nr:hypothetical protein [Clostridia bacterium]
MSKLKSIDKQLEEMSMKWYIKEYYGDQIRANNTREFRSKVIKHINNSVNKNDIVKEYLEEHPKVKKQYIQKKQTIKRVKTVRNLLFGLGALTLVGVVGTKAYSNNKQSNEPEKQAIEYTLYEEPEIEENEYQNFFEEVRSIENTSRRDDEIVKYTKQKIVEAYNMQNKDNPITVDSLEYLELNEYVVAHIDARGYDVSYDRISQRIQYEQKENEVLKKMTIYDFRIDGKTVAVYNTHGDEVVDSNIENKETFFKDIVDLLDKTTKLQGAYKYRNSEYDISRLQDNYQNSAEKLIKKQQEEQVDIEIIK